ncbi:class I SAM-dependent methyltransferase [Ruania alkalisoli]|uniref:class I SAM-dependent methyltransferase n=1 Tax=Ruania alkalisoli TaxID=2779775 RepID=UPI001FEBA37A|nr:class I SAM-dependent methyltransferase [Ruania alkalisoli]
MDGPAASLGVQVEGVDPTPEFLASAVERYPGPVFRLGRAEDLGVPGGSLAGVLAWYSIIHTEPVRIGPVFTSLARTLRPGGELLLGFFAAEEGEIGPVPFDHKVVRAYRWPVQVMTDRLVVAGLGIRSTHTRAEPGVRPHAAIRAQRPG